MICNIYSLGVYFSSFLCLKKRERRIVEAGEAKKIQDWSIELLFFTLIQEPPEKWMEHFVLQMTLRGGLENPHFCKRLLPCPSMGPNHLGRVRIVLDGSNSFWSGPNHFGQVQTIKISPEKSNMNLTKMIWTRPKQFGHDQNN